MKKNHKIWWISSPLIISRLVLLAGLILLMAGLFAPAFQALKNENKVYLSLLNIRAGRIIRGIDGTVFRFVPAGDGNRSLPLFYENTHFLIEEDFIKWPSVQAIIKKEDKNFLSHPGIDIWALFRSTMQNLRARRIKSGASTITMQLIRILRPRPRNIHSKLIEMINAFFIEKDATKYQLLGAYLDLVPFGNNIRGIALISQILFKKGPQFCDQSQAAILATLIQAPGKLDPYSGNMDLLHKKAQAFYIGTNGTGKEYQKAHIYPFELPFIAPHACDLALANWEKMGNIPIFIDITIDPTIQKMAEKALFHNRNLLNVKGAGQGAIIVQRNKDATIAAMVGSIGWEEKDQGFVNGALARRSAGSTLKPFLYALAFEKGWNPGDIIQDLPVDYPMPNGIYSPNNSDKRSHGPVSIRKALASSLNMPAAWLLNVLGLKEYYQLLKNAGFDSGDLWKDPDHYGIGLALGNGEISLLELVNAFSIFPNRGRYLPSAILKNRCPESWNMAKLPEKNKFEREVLSPASCAMILDILSDKSARTKTFFYPAVFDYHNPIAIKTGTSTDYRDAWCAAILPEWTLGAWAGNFDGHKTNGLTGATGPGWIIKDLCLELGAEKMPWNWEKEPSIRRAFICASSGLMAGPNCTDIKEELFKSNKIPFEKCNVHKDIHVNLPPVYDNWLDEKSLYSSKGRFIIESAVNPGDPGLIFPKITWPLDNSVLLIKDNQPLNQLFSAQVLSNRGNISWFIDNVEAGISQAPHNISLKILPGPHKIIALGDDGTSHSITISVERLKL